MNGSGQTDGHGAQCHVQQLSLGLFENVCEILHSIDVLVVVVVVFIELPQGRQRMTLLLLGLHSSASQTHCMLKLDEGTSSDTLRRMIMSCNCCWERSSIAARDSAPPQCPPWCCQYAHRSGRYDEPQAHRVFSFESVPRDRNHGGQESERTPSTAASCCSAG